MNKKKIIIISAIVVIILALIIGLIVFGGKDTKSKDKEQPTTTEQQETTTEKETSTEKESESLTEQETETTSEEPTTEETTTEEQSKDNAVIESGDNEQLIPAGHEKYFYVQCGMRIGWNDSAKMGYEAGDYFYVANNGDIYYFSSEADKNSFDSSNPNKAFLFYVEGTGLVGGTTGEAHTTQPTESPTQQPTTEPTTQGGGHENTEQETTSSEEHTGNKRPLSDPSQIIVNPDGGYDPNDQ